MTPVKYERVIGEQCRIKLPVSRFRNYEKRNLKKERKKEAGSATPTPVYMANTQ